MAQYPVHPDQPEVAGMVDQHVMFVTKQSKHKDAAFKVIETITSDEIQKKLTRASGKMSVLKEQSIRKELGADMPVLQGKHTEAIFKGRYIPAYTATNKYPDAGKFLNEAAAKYFQGEQDVNTALRTADEAIQNHIRQVDAATGKSKACAVTKAIHPAEEVKSMRLSNGCLWTDTSGNPIHAHGGGMLRMGEYVYWFGENRQGRNRVACYRSKNMTEWEFRGNVLTVDSVFRPIETRTSPELVTDRDKGTGRNMERPKVVYNEATGKFVMWMHWENGKDYGAA